MLWPAARVRGRASPLIVNSEVLMLASVTVRPEPLAVSVPAKLLVCPTTTLPKLSAGGFSASCPETVAVPVREIVSLESEAFEITEIDPIAVPPEVGLNKIPKVKLCAGLRVRGRFNPVMRKGAPVTLA